MHLEHALCELNFSMLGAGLIVSSLPVLPSVRPQPHAGLGSAVASMGRGVFHSEIHRSTGPVSRYQKCLTRINERVSTQAAGLSQLAAPLYKVVE